MALRLRKDVQKASYYVWFLGAEEARGLRGPRILLSAIPYLVERSRELEPIKVTLQVSHKGMKIVQGSSKHFITHSAITCSVQTDDIVACILLLYNPITKCPLHVHAYRCDSESTAQALHQQLQVLINRPENQKRFAELESRLGLLTSSPTARNSLPPPPLASTKSNPTPQMIKESPPKSHRMADERQLNAHTNAVGAPLVKRFDSSVGSDTGTSTRESECSEEHTPVSPLSPISATKASLYDSLAAELRAKLNGNGPPLLLPPRDYDTVHRSKGNLAATELRRCRNTMIVGGPGSKHGVSSRGSSGIGSDLAPSPERQEAQSSSDEDWLVKKRQQADTHANSTSLRRSSAAVVPANKQQLFNAVAKKPLPTMGQQRLPADQPPSYLYPLQKQAYIIPTTNSSSNSHNNRTSYLAKGDEGHCSPPKEEEIKPKLMRPRNLDAHFKQILSEKQFVPSDEMEEDDEDQDFNDDEQRFRNDSVSKYVDRSLEKKKLPAVDAKHVQRTKSAPATKNFDENDDAYRYRYRESSSNGHAKSSAKYRIDMDEEENIRYRENLTDKQKYRESLIEKQRNVQNMYHGRHHNIDDGFRTKESASSISPPSHHESKGSYKNKSKQTVKQLDYDPEETTIDRKAYRHKSKALPTTKYDDNVEFDRNPYKEPESLPYRESIERMIKSPAMRYKSFEENDYRGEVDFDEERMSDEKERFSAFPLAAKYRDMHISQPYANDTPDFGNGSGSGMYDPNERHSARQRFKDIKQRSQSRSPDTVMRVPPKERFQNAKEKFKAIERDRPYVVDKVLSDRPYVVEKSKNSSRRMVHEDLEPISHLNTRHLPPRQDPMLDWSSDEEQFARATVDQSQQKQQHHHHHRQQQPPSPVPTNVRIVPREHYEKNVSSRMAPSKSLGNLVKGHRHSYAEPPAPPRNPMPRNSGRVGLAAVNPY